MKRLYRWFFIIIFFLPITLLLAQGGADIEFNKTEFDFGRIAEKQGLVSTVFTFTNKGNSPLVINQVVASCGCTTPEWTKAPVEPGKSGEIKITFNPSGRPGAFVKTIAVMSNAAKSRSELRIRGYVESNEIVLAVQYPVIMGNIRLNKRSVQIGEINSKAIKNGQLEVINMSSRPTTLKFAGLPHHISVECSKPIIKPKDTAQILIRYSASAIKDWGARKDDFYLLYEDENRITSDRRITVSAVIKEDFSKLTPGQRANSPRIEVSENKIDFGPVTPGQRISKEIKIKNTGKSVLHIRKITNNNKALKPSVNRMSIPAGGEATLSVTLDGSQIKRPVAEKLIILTNDPDNYSFPLRITATPNR